jgi:hypothetical protein
METTELDFRYIDAERLGTSAGRLDDVAVVSPSNAPLGKLDGVIVDPAERQVRYYVVASRGWLSSRHYLLPLRPARLIRDRRALEVDVEVDEIKKCEQVDPDALPQFSDEDLVTAIFRTQAA